MITHVHNTAQLQTFVLTVAGTSCPKDAQRHLATANHATSATSSLAMVSLEDLGGRGSETAVLQDDSANGNQQKW